MTELHFVGYYDAVRAVMASSEEEAMEAARQEKESERRLYYVGSESDVKDNLEDNEVVHL